MRITLYFCFVFTLLTSGSFAQCILSANDDTQQEAIDCLTSCGCSEIEIPNTVTVELSEDWDLSSQGIISFTIKTGGKLELPGQGVNNRSLILASGSIVIVEDTNDNNAISGGNGNGQVKITIGDEDFNNGQISSIISAGGVSEDGIGVLPVELLFFNANITDGQIELKWSTASELNNDIFTLERSRNGKDFELITTIEGNGTTTLESNYEHVDNNPYLGLSFYRLSQTDYDGTTEVFPMISVVYTSRSNKFTISPNPIRNQNIKLKASGRGRNEQNQLNIIDLQGKLIEATKLISDNYGNLDIDLQLKNQLKKGTYIIELLSETHKEYLKVVVSE